MKKGDIIENFTTALEWDENDEVGGGRAGEGKDGGREEGGYEREDSFGEFEMDLGGDQNVSSLKSVLNQSSALLSLVEMDKVKEAFLAMDEVSHSESQSDEMRRHVSFVSPRRPALLLF